MRPILLTLLATSCIFYVEVDHDRQTFDVDDPVTAIDVTDVTGDVRIQGADVSSVHVVADLSWNDREPDLSWTVDGDTLFIVTDCPKPSWYCSVDLTIEVPAALAATVYVTTGDVTVRDLSGDVVVADTTGTLSFWRLSGDLDAHTTTGDVTGRDLGGAVVTVGVTTGEIDLDLAGPFDAVDAETTTGNITLLVPAGHYDVSAETTTGRVDVTGVVDDPTASSTITAHTTTGDVEITGYVTGDAPG